MELVQRFEEKADAFAEKLMFLRSEGNLLWIQLRDEMINVADSGKSGADARPIIEKNTKLIQLQERVSAKLAKLSRP